MSHDGTTEYWFFNPDVLPLALHATWAGRVDGEGPVLHLMAQGRLHYLATNARPPQRVNPFQPDSVQHVYAVGYAPDAEGTGRHAGVPDQRPALLRSTPLMDRPGGPLIRALHPDSATANDWLVVTVDRGQTRWAVRALPHPARAAQWIQVELELHGIAGSYPGEIVDNLTNDGWCLPRFTPEVAGRIVADLARMPVLPPGLTRLRLAEHPHRDELSGVVGLDEDGYYRVGAGGWPWVSRTLHPEGRRFLFAAPSQFDRDRLPARGQTAFCGLGALMWLVDGDLVTRPVDSDGDPDPDEDPVRPSYHTIDAGTAMQLRAVQHQLRLTAAAGTAPHRG